MAKPIVMFPGGSYTPAPGSRKERRQAMIGGKDDGPHWVPKERVPVRIQLKDGNNLDGSVFVSAEMRILDLLNSYHAFIAFEHQDGEFEILNKDLIAKIKPVGAW